MFIFGRNVKLHYQTVDTNLTRNCNWFTRTIQKTNTKPKKNQFHGKIFHEMKIKRRCNNWRQYASLKWWWKSYAVQKLVKLNKINFTKKFLNIFQENQNDVQQLTVFHSNGNFVRYKNSETKWNQFHEKLFEWDWELKGGATIDSMSHRSDGNYRTYIDTIISFLNIFQPP